jgi:RNA polymerase sigma-70 factor (ECF subfamily)
VSAAVSSLQLAEPDRPAQTIEGLFAAHYRWVWRTLRRLGVAESAVDDAAQQVFLVTADRVDRIAPGCERTFLTGVALRVAANARRSASRRRDEPAERIAEQHTEVPDPEQLLEQKQRREQLDRWLDVLPLEQRAPFVLFELEGFSLAEIAASLDLPLGTVKTRLRLARQAFLKRASSEGANP